MSPLKQVTSHNATNANPFLSCGVARIINLDSESAWFGGQKICFIGNAYLGICRSTLRPPSVIFAEASRTETATDSPQTMARPFPKLCILLAGDRGVPPSTSPDQSCCPIASPSMYYTCFVLRDSLYNR